MNLCVFFWLVCLLSSSSQVLDSSDWRLLRDPHAAHVSSTKATKLLAVLQAYETQRQSHARANLHARGANAARAEAVIEENETHVRPRFFFLPFFILFIVHEFRQRWSCVSLCISFLYLPHWHACSSVVIFLLFFPLPSPFPFPLPSPSQRDNNDWLDMEEPEAEADRGLFLGSASLRFRFAPQSHVPNVSDRAAGSDSWRPCVMKKEEIKFLLLLLFCVSESSSDDRILIVAGSPATACLLADWYRALTITVTSV